MTDFTQMMDSPPPADWTEAGIFRAAFLAVFDAEDRAVLRQAGKILALSAIAGDPESDPADHYRGAVQDAQALAVYLEEVRELATEAEPDHPAAAVAKDAEHWRRELEDVVAGMEADLRRLLKAGEPAPDPVAPLADAARTLVRDQRERVRLLRGSSALVDALEDAVAAVEGAKATDP